MIEVTYKFAALICVVGAVATSGVLGQFNHRKPWPMYSLQNMPQTTFTCHNKILGGYYADSETQCQMFHVCVKVAGVGVQDFRFLCPNGTAFDQEAQICADWGDVDCEQSVLYYGSDNFDLYRLGSGFESKRAPLAEEEEATFHLQRAESADIRRSKQTRVDQKSRPDQPPNYTKQYESAASTTIRNPYGFSNTNNRRTQQYGDQDYSNNDDVRKVTQNFEVTRKPTVTSYYKPTTSTTTTTTEKSYNDYNTDARQDSDDLFKGSHSSHFFSNRNGGREDDFLDHQPVLKIRPNDFNDYVKTSEASVGKTKLTPRGRRVKQPQANGNSFTLNPTVATTSTTTTAAPFPIITKKLTLQTSFSAGLAAGFDKQQKSTTPASSTITTNTTPSNIQRSVFSTFNQYPNTNHRYNLTQQNVQPTTYNPGNSVFRLKTTTSKYNDANALGDGNQKSVTTNFYNPQYENQQFDNFNKLPNNNRNRQQQQPQQQQQNSKLNVTSSSSPSSRNDFSDFSKLPAPSGFQAQGYRNAPNSSPPQKQQQQQLLNVKPLEHRNLANNQTEPQQQRGRSASKQNRFVDTQNIEPQYFRSRQAQPETKNVYREPTPFSSRDQQPLEKVKTTSHPDSSPRGFASRGHINYKATTLAAFNRGGENFTPSTNTVKKFSTLVPKDQYYPTTFKPTTYKKAYENAFFQSQSQKPTKTLLSANQNRNSPPTTTTTIAPLPTTIDPYNNPDEDDGQYHPELYETDFHIKRPQQQTKSSQITTTTTIKPLPTHPYVHRPQISLQSQQLSKVIQKQNPQQNYYQNHQQANPDELSDEDELFKTAQSLNLGAASLNKLRADKLKSEKTTELQSSPKVSSVYSLPTTSPYPQVTQTPRPLTTTTTTTTKRPPIVQTVPPPAVHQHSFPSEAAPKKATKSSKSGKTHKKSSKNSSSKRPPHADDDTSYDYAYYDSLSETPQEYQEYDVISEFTKTRKN